MGNIVLCNLVSIIGSLSNHSFVTNIFNEAKAWLNEAFQVVGISGTFHYQGSTPKLELFRHFKEQTDRSNPNR